MITALQAVQMAAEVYDAPPSAWTNFWDEDGVVLAHRVIGADHVLAFRGSVTALDWARDAAAVPVVDLEVGMVHGGFAAGLDGALAKAMAVIPNGAPISLTGHSLGGARARIAAAKLLLRGCWVTSVRVFGSPKPGFGRLASIFAGRPCVHQSWRHGEDPVPMLPLGTFWRHTEQWQALPDLGPQHPAGEVVDNLLDHRVANYVKGIAALA